MGREGGEGGREEIHFTHAVTHIHPAARCKGKDT